MLIAVPIQVSTLAVFFSVNKALGLVCYPLMVFARCYYPRISASARSRLTRTSDNTSYIAKWTTGTSWTKMGRCPPGKASVCYVIHANNVYLTLQAEVEAHSFGVHYTYNI